MWLRILSCIIILNYKGKKLLNLTMTKAQNEITKYKFLWSILWCLNTSGMYDFFSWSITSEACILNSQKSRLIPLVTGYNNCRFQFEMISIFLRLILTMMNFAGDSAYCSTLQSKFYNVSLTYHKITWYTIRNIFCIYSLPLVTIASGHCSIIVYYSKYSNWSYQEHMLVCNSFDQMT